MRAATGVTNLHNDSAATRAWRTFFAEHAGVVEVLAFGTLGIQVVAVGAATLFDGEVHDVAKAGVEMFEICSRQRRH